MKNKNQNEELTTEVLYRMSLKDLEDLADALATKALFFHDTGKHLEEPERYKRMLKELYHVAQVYDYREYTEIDDAEIVK